MSSLAILHASQLVSLAGPKRARTAKEMSELATVHNGGMLIRDGRIDIVGTSDEIEKQAGDAKILDAGQLRGVGNFAGT